MLIANSLFYKLLLPVSPYLPKLIILVGKYLFNFTS